MELVELGYLLVGASETGTWRLFAEQVVGAMTLDGPQRSLYVKIDERAFRIAVLPGQRAARVWLDGSERARVSRCTRIPASRAHRDRSG